MHEKHLNDLKLEKERKIQTQKDYWDDLERTRLIKEAQKKEMDEREKRQQEIEVKIKEKELEEVSLPVSLA